MNSELQAACDHLAAHQAMSIIADRNAEIARLKSELEVSRLAGEQLGRLYKQEKEWLQNVKANRERLRVALENLMPTVPTYPCVVDTNCGTCTACRGKLALTQAKEAMKG